MAKLKWDAENQRKVEYGLSKGVLYPRGGPGVAWNGLTAVSEKPKGGDIVKLYADNVQYATLRSFETYEATIEAYTYPEEFAQCDGSVKVTDGVKIGQQKRKPFDFCYRTEIKVASDSVYDQPYKLHLVFNATASPSERNYQTLNTSPEATSLSWDIQTMPFIINGHTGASTLVIDSTEVDRIKLEALESILYGLDGEPPRMPDPDEVVQLLQRLDLHRLLMNAFTRSGKWRWDTFNFFTDTVPIAIDREAQRHIYCEPEPGTTYIQPSVAYKLLNENENGRRKYMLIVVDTDNPSDTANYLKTQLDLRGEEIIRSGNVYYYTYTLYI
jgi:hypothetical protein